MPIMEMVIPEFEGCSQEEILNCLDLASITSDEVVSDVPVSETDEYRIRGERRQLLNLSGVYMKWILQMI